MEISMTVNGEPRRVDVGARQTLSEVIRENLGLTGTHVGCEQGVCGACTVWVDGVAVRSCLTLAPQVDGREVTTVESLTEDPEAGGEFGMHPLQQSFLARQAQQCGFCTSGFLMTALAAVREEPRRSREDWRSRLSGNLCRCTGYEAIIDAVIDYAEGETREQ